MEFKLISLRRFPSVRIAIFLRHCQCSRSWALSRVLMLFRARVLLVTKGGSRRCNFQASWKAFLEAYRAWPEDYRKCWVLCWAEAFFFALLSVTKMISVVKEASRKLHCYWRHLCLHQESKKKFDSTWKLKTYLSFWSSLKSFKVDQIWSWRKLLGKLQCLSCKIFVGSYRNQHQPTQFTALHTIKHELKKGKVWERCDSIWMNLMKSSRWFHRLYPPFWLSIVMMHLRKKRKNFQFKDENNWRCFLNQKKTKNCLNSNS